MQPIPEITLLQELIEQQEQPVLLCSATGEIRYANRQARQLSPSENIIGKIAHISDNPYLMIGSDRFTLQERKLHSPELRWFYIWLQSEPLPPPVSAQPSQPSSDSINHLLLQLSGSLLQGSAPDKGIVSILQSITQMGNYDATVIYSCENNAWSQQIQACVVRNLELTLPDSLLYPDKETLNILIESIGPRARYFLHPNNINNKSIEKFYQIVAKEGFHSVILVPIRSEQQIEGILAVFSSQPLTISQKKLDAVLVFFTYAFANSIRNMRIKQQIESYITARNVAQNTAHQALTILENLLENTPLVAIQGYDMQGKVIYWNKHSEKIYHYAKNQAIGSHVSDLFHNAGMFLQQLNSIASLQQPLQPTELHIKTKKGKKLWIIFSLIPVLNQNRALTIYSMQVDITRIKDMEAQERIAKTALQQYSLQINQQNQDLIEKEKALMRTNEALRINQHKLDNVIRELSERNYELDEFVHRVSHNIRAPFTSLLGVIDVMQIYIGNPEMLKELMDKMVASIKRLDDYVRAMLEYLQANRKAEELSVINIELLLEDCMANLSYIDNFSRVRVCYNIPPDNQPFKSDATRLSIILSNLISNAIKYANVYKNDNYLEITAQIGKEKGVFVIKDNGIGIKSELVDKVFDMFFRAHEFAQGSGLGLYIVKQTVNRMGGTIEMQTEYGQGTTFTVTLPNMLNHDAPEIRFSAD